MLVKMFLANKADHLNTQYHVIVAWLPQIYNCSITTLSFDPFQAANAGSCGNLQLLSANKDKGVKFYYDSIHAIKTQQDSVGSGTKQLTKTVKLWIRLSHNLSVQVLLSLIQMTILYLTVLWLSMVFPMNSTVHSQQIKLLQWLDSCQCITKTSDWTQSLNYLNSCLRTKQSYQA